MTKITADVRILLQARLSSQRLPAKVLLPVGGMPLVVLASLRAGNRGLPVVVATSENAEDSLVADAVSAAGIAVFRGSLTNVHGRFLAATQDLDDNAWIVRLTGDNCLPDGLFIEGILEQAIDRGVAYLGTASPADGLPYGLSVEVFKAGALRAVANELTDFDREHVTPAIKRRFGATVARVDSPGWSQLRCTVDTFRDYQQIQQLFKEVDNPIQTPWRELCERLSDLPGAPRFRVPWQVHAQGLLSKLTLGTAQLGLPCYGRVNQTGRPEDAEATRLLETAVRHGITHFDTARVYGDAEARIGRIAGAGLYAQPVVITKLDPLADLGTSADQNAVQKWVDASVLRSMHNLGLSCLPVVMLHRWQHYRDFDGQVWQRLNELKAEGCIHQLGASVYDPTSAIEAFAEPAVTSLQIPFNLLDHRWRSDAFRKARQSRPDVAVFCRSAFLQGLLVSDASHWPTGSGWDAVELVRKLDQLTTRLGRQSRADLCLAYLLGSPLVDSIVIGVETVAQLKTNLELSRTTPLTEIEQETVHEELACVPEQLLDPSKW